MKYLLCFLIIIGVFSVMITVDSGEGITFYVFNRYPYKKKPKNERRIKNVKMQCEELEECIQAQGLDQQKCVRTCMSPNCYQEVYAPDEMEEGEIDVRYTSFKGCVLQELPKP